MSILDRWLTRAPSPQQPLQQRVELEFLSPLDHFVRIPALDFFGEFSWSPSREWIICWLDADPGGTRSGNRERGHGRYVLVNAREGRVACQGRLERPNHGHVADTGHFALEDWHFGGGLSGTLAVFDAKGGNLLNHRFAANLFSSGISARGRYAICQTANAPGPDGNVLSVFDIARQARLFGVQPANWATTYDIVEEAPRFGLVFDALGTFYYDAEGCFVDAGRYQAARLASSRFIDVVVTVQQMLEAPDLPEQTLRDLLAAIRRARTLGADADRNWKPLALKLQGMVSECLGDASAALAAYEEALALDPKIGLKRKAELLRKKISSHR